MQTYLKLAVANFTIVSIISEQPWKQQMTNIVLIIILVAFVIFSLIFMVIRKDLDDEETRHKYGTMYLNLDINKRGVRYMPFLSLARKLMLGLSIAFFKYKSI